MATTRWAPASLDRADVWTLTLGGTWTAGDTVTLAVPSATAGPAITLTLGSTVTTAQIAAEIETAWNEPSAALGTGYSVTERGANIPQFAEYTAEASGSTVVFTAGTKGVPGTIAATRVTASSGTVAMSNTTPATGKNFFDQAVNYSGGAVPVDSDVVYFDSEDVQVLYGLGQSAVEPAAVHFPMTYSGAVGLPEVNEAGGYYEYRATYLELGPAALVVGAGAGTGSGRLKLNSTSDVCAVKVLNTGSPLEANLPALLWKGTNASNTWVQSGGSGGVAVFGGETATLSTVALSGGELLTGSGVTLSGALTVTGGQWNINSKIDGTMVQEGGTVVFDGTDGCDQLTVRGGTFLYNASGTLAGNTVVEGTGVLDMGTMPTTVSVTNAITLRGQNCQFIDPTGRTGNAAFVLTGGATVAQLVLKQNPTVTLS